MPLSDREQQILSDIEARLREEDPRLARTVSTTTISSEARRRIKLAVAGAIIGFILLLAVVPLASIWYGLAGFAVMLVSIVYGANQLKRFGQEDAPLGGQLRGGLRRYMDRGES